MGVAAAAAKSNAAERRATLKRRVCVFIAFGNWKLEAISWEQG